MTSPTMRHDVKPRDVISRTMRHDDLHKAQRRRSFLLWTVENLDALQQAGDHTRTLRLWLENASCLRSTPVDSKEWVISIIQFSSGYLIRFVNFRNLEEMFITKMQKYWVQVQTDLVEVLTKEATL